VTTVENDTVTSFILGVVRDTLNMPLPEDTGPDTPLGLGGLELESLTMVELTVAIEREYGISLPDDVIDDLATGTVGALVSTVKSLRPLGMEDIKRLLVDSKILAEGTELPDDAEVVLDSLSLVWFQHQLTEQYGIEVEFGENAVTELTTVARIHAFLAGATGR
jgi:acyl carrier protein